MAKPTRKTIGKYDRKSPAIGFPEWNLDAFEEDAVNLLNKAFKEGIDIATREYKVTAEFTHVKKKDVTTITVGLPIGPEEYVDPTWEFDLAELVENEIFDAKDSAAAGDPDTSRLIALGNRLRTLADRMDKAINTINSRGKPPD